MSFVMAAGMAFAAAGESEAVLKRAAARVQANSNSIRSYTCVETVQRDYYRPRAATLPRECRVLMKLRERPTLDMELVRWSRDRLRLEVATSRVGEVESWPGAAGFTDAGIDTLVRDGPIGTGAFGAMLNVIFFQDVQKFGMAGESVEGGRRRFRYTFSAPVSESHYRMKAADGNAWLTVGYEGVLDIDAETADPVRLMVVTNDMPAATGACQTASSLSFARVRLSGDEVLLPTAATQSFIGATGRETRNTISFSGCRQYTSESTVSYYSAEDEALLARSVKRPPAPEIPEWLPFSMELLTPLDSETAAAGDRFLARLTGPLRDGKRLIAGKGATIEGRVSGVEIGYWPAATVGLGLVPESLEIAGMKAPFAARLDLRAQTVALEKRKTKGLEFFLPPPGEYAHELRFNGVHIVLGKGFVSAWMTAARKRE